MRSIGSSFSWMISFVIRWSSYLQILIEVGYDLVPFDIVVGGMDGLLPLTPTTPRMLEHLVKCPGVRFPVDQRPVIFVAQ